MDKNGGAWCPRNMIGRDAGEWIEINLGVPHVITATETMGRFGNGQGAEYAEAYVIEYYRYIECGGGGGGPVISNFAVLSRLFCT